MLSSHEIGQTAYGYFFSQGYYGSVGYFACDQFHDGTTDKRAAFRI